MDQQKIRRHIIFHGRVQGVGFRWHARTFASQTGLTGWVQNLEDGTVEMEVQGTKEKIQRLLDYMDGRQYVMIEKIESSLIPTVESEWTFHERGWYKPTDFHVPTAWHITANLIYFFYDTD